MSSFFAALLLLPAVVFPRTTVSLDARGQDVREALATLFAQARKPYALDAAIRGSVYMKFDRLPYDRALEIVTRQAGLIAKEESGVVMVSLVNPPPTIPEKTDPPKSNPAKPPKPAPNPTAILARRVSTHLSRTPLADVFASFGKQAGVVIDLDPKVPAYRIDATFKNVPLRSALDQICKATGLKYGFSAGSIKVSRR